MDIRPADATELLTAILPTKQPILLLGAPGCGKSSIGRQVASSLGWGYKHIVTTMLESVDIKGVPHIKSGQTTWALPDFFPQKGPYLMVFEELPQAEPDTQKALMPVFLERQIGDYHLPDDVYIFATGNRAKDRAGASVLNTALANRMQHFTLTVSVEDWQNWALTNGISPEVRAFINYKPNLLFDFKPELNPLTFPSPRSWEAVNRVLKVTPQRLALQSVSGCVGDGPAAEFVGFLELYKQLPDIDLCLGNPTGFTIPTNPAVLFSLIGAMGERIRQKKFPAVNFAKVGMRLPDEFGVLAIRDAMTMDKKIVTDQAVQDWVRQARSRGLFQGA